MSERITDPEKLRIPLYDAADKAQKTSRRREAISAWPVRISIVGVGMMTRFVPVQIVYPMGKDPYYVYATAHGIKIPFSVARPGRIDVDRTRYWKAN